MARVSDFDEVYLAGETPTQHLHVLATMLVDSSGLRGANPYELFQSRIAERFHLIEPLRQRLKPVPFARPRWVDDPDLHIRRHLHHVILPEGGGMDALTEVAGEIASSPLARDRPLWEVWFIEGVDDTHNAVIAKIHHAAVDGITGIYALAAFFDLEPDPPPPDSATVWQAAAPPGAVAVGRSVLADALRRPVDVARSVHRVGWSALTLARTDRGEAPLPFSGPRLSLNGPLTARRSVAFTTVPLDEIKQVRRALGASVNDVLVALCAGVLRRYALERGETCDRPLVAGVPISERTEEHGAAGNQLSFLFYALPVHLDDPWDRLAFVSRSASTVKSAYERGGQGLFASLATLAPKRAVTPLMRAVSAAGAARVLPPVVNVMISNIRGPDLPLYSAGSKLTSLFPMGPLLEGVGLGITVVSYRDEIAFGFMACPDLIPDVGQLARSIRGEMGRMLEATPDSR